MDEIASKRFLEESIKRLKRIAKQLGTSEEDVVVDGPDIYIPILSSLYNRKFMLRVRTTDSYPAIPADYIFVNPENCNEIGVQHWPNDNGQAFKLQNPPWICMAGTLAWVQHGHPNPGSNTNLIENAVFSIFVKLNKVA
jgi:hypothetical protein